MRTAMLMGTMLWPLVWWPTLVHSQPNTLNIIRPDPTSVDAEYDGVVICFRCDVAPTQIVSESFKDYSC
jgi:hypothetical protein